MEHSSEKLIYGYSTTDEPKSRLYSVAKQSLFRLAKGTGLYGLARRRTRRGLRILCYHAFSIEDEYSFRPRLFMQASTFRRRMAYLHRNAFPVLSLDEALDRLDADTLPCGSTVITIDDGFYSVYRHALPILQEFSFPATLYVATRDFLRAQPIFRLVVQYMFWKSSQAFLDSSGLMDGPQSPISLNSEEERHRIMWQIVRFGDALETDEERSSLASKLGERLGSNYREIVRKRLFSLVTSEELDVITGSRIQVQLHTHTHQLPEDRGLADQEIRDNRETLMRYANSPLQHFCYPSGIWNKGHWPLLKAANIRSATTCKPGLNYPDTPRLALNRFLDGDDILPVEFEAEMSGFADVMRLAHAGLTRGQSP